VGFNRSEFMKPHLTEYGIREREFLDGIAQLPRSSRAACRTILLISNDRDFHQNLRSRANAVGLLVVRAELAVGTLPILQATKPQAVLLDLDLPDEAAWQTAALVLSEACCPEVILLTARTAQFDMRTAIRAGSLVTKSESPERVLQLIEEKLELPEANRTERNAIQRVLMGWLRPSGWEGPTTPSFRFWGINE
jgi:DNA-binding NtrC family response regulator